MKYTIVKGNSPSALSDSVCKLAMEGWIPEGGVCCVVVGGVEKFYQALTRGIR